MWTRNPRNLLEIERSWIMRLHHGWPAECLDPIQVIMFNVDNAHTIRNAAQVNESMKPIATELATDVDGAPVEVILYVAEKGDFGELEFNRLDTRPLIGVPKLNT